MREITLTPTTFAVATANAKVQLILRLQEFGGGLSFQFGTCESLDSLIGALLDHRRALYGKTPNQKKMLSLLRHAERVIVDSNGADGHSLDLIREAMEMLK